MSDFCSVCEMTDREKVKEMPKNCVYDGFGVSICCDCCQSCESHGACAEGFVLFPSKKEKKREIVGIFRCFDGWI